MTALDPYLIFNGNCAEAMRFYADSLDGTLETLLTYGASPVAPDCPVGNAERVMHARVRFGDRSLMASDCPAGQPYDGMRHVSVCLTFETVEEATRVYDLLRQDGELHMAMAPTFWAGAFAMLVDRYGTPWMINGALIQLSNPA
jgi:PhnB protein